MKQLIWLAVFLMAMTACSKPDPLHDSMEGMGDAFKAMRESNDLAEVKVQWQNFKASLEIAEAQQVKPDDQGAFDEGMDELTELAMVVDAGLAAGDLAAAKDAMKRMGEVRKQYHDELGVD